MGDLTVWPAGSCGAAATGAAAAGASAGAAATGAACITWGWATPCAMAGPPLTMRTLPSASVISSSETFDSDTRSINVLSLRKSIRSPRGANERREFCADGLDGWGRGAFTAPSAQGCPLLQIGWRHAAHSTLEHLAGLADHNGEG